MNTSSKRKMLRANAADFSFEPLEPRNMLAADLTNLAFGNFGNTGLIYQLSESVPVEQRLEVLEFHTGINDKGSFQLKKVESDQLGFTHFRYQQLAYGMPVENGIYTVHARDGQIESISGDYILADQADPTIKLHEREAFIKALDYATSQLSDLDRHHHGDITGNLDVQMFEPTDSPQFMWQYPNGQINMAAVPQGELMFVQTGEGEVSLSYKFDIYVANPLFKADIFVDATSGDIIKEIEGIKTIDTPASGLSLYNGNVSFTADSFGPNPSYRLRTNGDAVVPAAISLDMQQGESYTSAIDTVSNTTLFNQANHTKGVQTHFGAENAVAYFANVHNRYSFDDNGSPLLSYFGFLNGYANAFWDGIRLSLGDGDGVNILPLVAIDVIGHEMTHGVTERSANLIYSFESGALNESFSDIFAEGVESFATNGNNDWEIAPDIFANGGALRSFSDPNLYGGPDTYLGTNWYSGSDDNGGVHTNSTVQNHWFYMLSEGLAGINDNGDNYNVTGIGMTDASRIAYRSLTTYLTPTSQYANARVASIQSAIDLFGLNSAQHLSTEAAWDAVGVYGFELHFTPRLVESSIGSLIYLDEQQGEISFAGLVEETTISVDAGQSISLYAESASVIPTLVVKDPAGNVVGSATGTSNSTGLHAAPVVVAGEYTIEISGENGTSGTYDIELILNACVESEPAGSHANNTIGTAEALDATSIPLGTSGVDRLAITGFLGEGAIVHAGDDFESGTFGPQWTLSSTQPDGLIENWGGPGTASGTQAMIMHQLPIGPFNLNEAIMTVDLAGVTGSRLKFWVAEWHEEPHYLPFGSFTGSADGDGVSISVDGNTWYPFLDFIETPYGEYIYYEFDLDSFTASKGIALSSNTQFKFQQYDNDSIYSDGLGWDDIEVSVAEDSEDWYSFALAAGEFASIGGSTVTGPQDLLVELYDGSGNLLRTGSQFENHSVISQFVNNGGADTFYVRASGTSLDYNLVVTRGADYDLEPNGQATPQDITNVNGVLGSVFMNRTISADPDLFNDGNIINTSFPGITLSNDINGGSVWAADTDEIFPAPTGTIVFAPEFGASDGWREFDNEFRVDFDQLQPFVSIDVGSDDDLDIGWLRAYDSNNVLLEQKQTGGIPFGQSQTLTITRPTEDIAYVVASGFDFHITPMDNLQYTEFVIDDDFYTVSASVGQQLDFNGILPSDGDFEFENGLDSATGSMLGMELFDPSGNLVASDNEMISHTALQAGVYTLRVYAQAGQGEYYIDRNLATNPIDVTILSTKFLDGSVRAGLLSNTNLGDDIYYQLNPSQSSNPIKQKIDLIVLAEIAVSSPGSFGFRVEASMSGGPSGDVTQTIQLWNESTAQWDLVDTRAASNGDLLVDAFATGDLTDYIHPQTGEIITNIVWESPSFSVSPFNWIINVDQAGWLIQ